jgi:hypothetical protein
MYASEFIKMTTYKPEVTIANMQWKIQKPMILVCQQKIKISRSMLLCEKI